MVGHDTKFTNRKDAGIQLGNLLKRNYSSENLLVLGISSGGVEVAHEVARILKAELSFLAAKKFRTSFNNEDTTGAVSEEDQIFIPTIRHIKDESVYKSISKNHSEEIKDCGSRYRNGCPLPDMKDKTVILVDDGIASRCTFVPAINLCRKRNAQKVIVAVPIGGENYINEVARVADCVEVIEQPENFYAIGQAYDGFSTINDQDVKTLLSHSSQFINKFNHKRNVVNQQMVAANQMGRKEVNII